MNTQLQGAFRALADPTRRQILLNLSEREMTIGEIVNQFEITRAAIKKHLIVLEEGQLISVSSRGRERVNRIEPEGLSSVVEWINYFDHFWDSKLSKLKQVLQKQENTH